MKQPNSKKPALTPDTQAFIDKLAKAGGPPLYTLTPQEARGVLAKAQAGPVKKPDAEIEDLLLPVGPAGQVDLRLVRPAGAKGRLPLVFYIHGGGWVMGDKNTHDRLVREIAVGVQAVVGFVYYTPSPEAQYPVPIQELFAALTHLVEKAEKFNLDPDNVAVAGDSVGGNMAIAMTLLAKAKKAGPKLKFQLLLYPVTDAAFETESYRDFADGPWLTRKAMKYFWDAYAPKKKQREEITVSPLRAKLKDLKNLPPALVITDQNDVLRDEGEAYAAKLMAAGVKTAAVRYNGTIHDFMMLNALADTEPARAATLQACAALREAFKS